MKQQTKENIWVFVILFGAWMPYVLWLFQSCATTRPPMFTGYDCAATTCTCDHGSDRDWIITTDEVGHVLFITCNICGHQMTKTQ